MKKINFLMLCVAMTTQVFSQNGDYLNISSPRKVKFKHASFFGDSLYISGAEGRLHVKRGSGTEYLLEPAGDGYLISSDGKYWVIADGSFPHDVAQTLRVILVEGIRDGNSLVIEGAKIALPLFNFAPPPSYMEEFPDGYYIIEPRLKGDYTDLGLAPSSYYRINVEDAAGYLYVAGRSISSTWSAFKIESEDPKGQNDISLGTDTLRDDWGQRHGNIHLTLETPEDDAFNMTFKLSLPAGFTVDIDATKLSSAIAAKLDLTVQEANGVWTFTIQLKQGVTTRATTSFIKIMDIAYRAEESIAAGDYEFSIKDLTYTGSTTIKADEIKTVVKIGNPSNNATIIDDLSIYSYKSSLCINASSDGTATVYNLLGGLVHTINYPAGFSSVPVPQGVYIVKAGTATQKVVIQ